MAQISLFRNIVEDFRVFARGPGLRSTLITLTLFVGFRATFLVRIQNWLYAKGRIWLSYQIHALNFSVYGIDVLPGCSIGPGLRLEHPAGVVIGSGVSIGRNCTIQSGVVLGSRSSNPLLNDYPCIGDYVLIGTKASILGAVTVGNHCKIGAHALVIKNLPPKTVVHGFTCK